MASMWQETMEGDDQAAHLASLRAQAGNQEALYMMWEEPDYPHFRHTLVGTSPSVPAYPAQTYMASMYSEAAVAYASPEGAIWPGDPTSMGAMHWCEEGGAAAEAAAAMRALPWCGGAQGGQDACVDLSHSRSTSSTTESLHSLGFGSEWGAETPELPTPPAPDHWPTLAAVPALQMPPAPPAQGVPDGYSAQFVIKNTFIETEAETEDEAEPFLRKRLVRSCPSSPAGRCGATSFDVILAAAQRLKMYKAKASWTEVPRSGSGLATPDPFAEEARDVQASADWAADFSTLDASADWAADFAALDAPSGRAPAAVQVLRLADVLDEPSSSAGSPELPSVGSAGHASGSCKPCAFAHTKGCWTGEDCRFCHLCKPSCARRRKKDWRPTVSPTGTLHGGRRGGRGA